MKQVVTSDNITISYNIKQGGDHCLVFLHGAGGNASAWKNYVTHYHNLEYTTLSIDLRGHGHSSRPKRLDQYTVERFAKDVVKVLQHENIKQYTLVGHCFGGMIAMKCHELSPAYAYVLIDSPYQGPFIARVMPACLLKPLTWLHRAHDGYEDFDKFIGTGDYNVRRILSDIKHTTLLSWVYTIAGTKHFNALNINVTRPVCIVHAANDSIVPLHQARRLHETLSNSTLNIIRNENHIVVFNNPKKVQRALSKFLDNLY